LPVIFFTANRLSYRFRNCHITLLDLREAATWSLYACFTFPCAVRSTCIV